MKTLITIFLVILSLTFFCCSEDSPESPSVNSNGKLFVQSNPSGAQIYLKGTNTGKTTPDTIKNLEQGTYNGFLYLQYYDTTYFTANVFNNTTSTVDTSLEDGLPFVEFSFDFQL
ncbi:MAG TPA: PEGA domain-containing protein, partial [Ignavibacteriaceae bacterium]